MAMNGQAEARVVNPEDLVIEVTVKMPLRQWQEVVKIVEEARYYAPLMGFIDEVRGTIRTVEQKFLRDTRSEALGE